jgi:hypothetical protein
MRNNMLMKGLVIGIIFLLIGTSIVPTILGQKLLPDELLSNESLLDDQLDQKNSDWGGMGIYNFNGSMAQSFKPTLNMLTRMEFIIMNGDIPQGDFTVSIRDNLTGIDLTNITIPIEDLPAPFLYPQVIWTEFDFPDIYVLPEHTYYIVCSYNPQIHPCITYWGCTGPIDNYTRGELWSYSKIWYSDVGFDFCFKTYGFNKARPNLHCEGNLSWNDVTPDSTVEGNIQIMNIGDPDSLLNWEIVETPEWGIDWTFTYEGDGTVIPEQALNVKVKAVAPNEKNKEFKGEIKIANVEDSNDFEIIPITLVTPINNEQFTHYPTLSWLFPRFPHAFPILRQLLGY